MSSFLLEFWCEKNDFCIYAEAENFEKELRLSGQAKEIVRQFETIYDTLQDLKTHKSRELTETIESLSERILAQFADPIKKSTLVRIIVYEDLVRCAFDLLHIDGVPLFLQRPVCYQVDEGTGEDEAVVELGSALLIADLTADPEEACLQVAGLIPNSTYAQMEDADLNMIKAAADEVDVLVISAHGDLEANNRGSLGLNDETLKASLVGKLEAWVIYFDSCQQGANMDYLEALQEKSDAQFYLAPIISNDAGDSSTKTMVWFFKAILQHKNPIRGLFETRKRLYNYYQGEEKLDLVTTLNKSFAFRLYELVD